MTEQLYWKLQVVMIKRLGKETQKIGGGGGGGA